MTTTWGNLIVLAGQRPLRLDDLPEEDHTCRYEVIDGSLYVTPLANVEHQRLVGSMVVLLASTIPEDAVVLPRRHDLTIKRNLYEEWKVPYLAVDRSTSPHTYHTFGDPPSWAEVVQP